MLSRYVVSQVKHNSYFLVGLGIGLWLALATVPLEEDVVACDGSATVATPDDFEPQREERPLGPAGQSGRSVQRPRYYSTELGMRGGLLAGVLSSEEVLETRAAALNKTAARLLPALRFFITASTLQVAPGRANVVGFTDTREMLKPFHALKYLADNYLEEYDFFFLISDTSFVNAPRLLELVSKLSVSQDLYMGAVADDDTHYCTLEGGILLSNSVLRAVHGELDWCVRNSYSPQHHENIGRCVLHAAHLPCAAAAQGQRYAAAALRTGALRPALADAVAAHPATHARHFHRLHAYVARVRLQRAAGAGARAAAAAARSARRHPRGFRNATWPRALRGDAGLAPPPPATRFDHLSWTRFNATHALLLGAREAAAPLGGAQRAAVARVVREARAWAAARWGVARGAVALAEGAWRWAPPRALRYRLLLRVGGALRLAEAARPLGAARLAPARYVTESARVHAVLALPAAAAARAAALLRRLERDANAALTVVIMSGAEAVSAEAAAALAALREAAAAGAALAVLDAPGPAAGGAASSAAGWRRAAARPALAAALPRLPRDALVLLLLAPEAEFTEDFLNRVRMNTISGEQWFAPVAFHRYAQAPPPAPAAPAAPSAPGAPPAPPAPRAAADAGRFDANAAPVALSFYRQDFEAALQAWRGAADAPPAALLALLAAAPLRALRAPEPALLLPPPPAPPCPAPAPRAPPAPAPACPRAALADAVLGARHTLARALLQRQAGLA